MIIKLKDGSTLAHDGVVRDQSGKVTVVLDAGVINMLRTGLVDADGAVYFSRELERIKSRTYDVKYPALKARSIFPVTNETGPGVESITYTTYDQVGVAQLIGAYAKDLPRSDVHGKQTTINVKTAGSSFGYSHAELITGQVTGRPLDARRASSCSRSFEELLNTVAWFGDAASGLQGLFSHPNIPTAAVVDGASASKTWENKTDDEIFADVHSCLNDIHTVSNMVHAPNKLLLAPTNWTLLNTRVRRDHTLASFIVDASPWLNSLDDIMPVNELEAANNPLLSANAMVAMEQTPDNFELEVPVETQFLPVQVTGLEYLVPAYMDVAGLNVYYPMAINISTGI